MPPTNKRKRTPEGLDNVAVSLTQQEERHLGPCGDNRPHMARKRDSITYPVPVAFDCLHLDSATLTTEKYLQHCQDVFVVDGDLEGCGFHIPDIRDLADFRRNDLVSPHMAKSIPAYNYSNAQFREFELSIDKFLLCWRNGYSVASLNWHLGGSAYDKAIRLPRFLEELSWAHRFETRSALDEDQIKEAKFGPIVGLTPADSCTGFHIDQAGSAALLYMNKGSKVFYVAEYSRENAEAYVALSRAFALEGRSSMSDCSSSQFESAFKNVKRIRVETGSLLHLPAGCFHAVTTQANSIVTTWNFVHEASALVISDCQAHQRRAEVQDIDCDFPFFKSLLELAISDIVTGSSAISPTLRIAQDLDTVYRRNADHDPSLASRLAVFIDTLRVSLQPSTENARLVDVGQTPSSAQASLRLQSAPPPIAEPALGINGNGEQEGETQSRTKPSLAEALIKWPWIIEANANLRGYIPSAGRANSTLDVNHCLARSRRIYICADCPDKTNFSDCHKWMAHCKKKHLEVDAIALYREDATAWGQVTWKAGTRALADWLILE